MPFPFVAVTLPPDTPPAYAVVLLEACTQAYPSGGCRLEPDTSSAQPELPPPDEPGVPATAPSAPPTSPGNTAAPGDDKTLRTSPLPNPSAGPTAAAPDEVDELEELRGTILGTVIWVDDNTAELLLGLPHWRNNRWLERDLGFKAEDDPLERHRAVGFALGSLAGTVAEVARLERESHDHEEPPIESAPQVVETPPAPSPPTPTAQAASSRLAPIPAVTSTRPFLFPQLWVGVDAGSGFAEPRLGAMMGLGLRFRSPWTLTLRARYGHETITDKQVAADYATVGAGLGARFRAGWLEAHAGLGGALDWIWIRSLAPDGKAVSEPVWWLTGDITLIPADLPVAPFLTFGAALGRAVDVGDIQGLAYGPLQLHAQLGLSLRFDLF